MSNQKDEPKLLSWRGHKVYRCRLCAFDTTDKARFEDHFRKAHAPLQIIEGRKQQVDEFHNMTVADLKAEAEKRGLALESSAKKADIIAALEAAPQEGE